MKFLTFISTMILTSFMSQSVCAQDIRSMLDKVQSEASSAFVTVVYSAEIIGPEGTVKDEGVIEAQDRMWHMKGTLLEIFTDDSGTWILDNAAREAYVEPAWSYNDLLTFYESVGASGSTLTAKILNTTMAEKQPVSFFTPSLPSDWVVTDLR